MRLVQLTTTGNTSRLPAFLNCFFLKLYSIIAFLSFLLCLLCCAFCALPKEKNSSKKNCFFFFFFPFVPCLLYPAKIGFRGSLTAGEHVFSSTNYCYLLQKWLPWLPRPSLPLVFSLSLPPSIPLAPSLSRARSLPPSLPPSLPVSLPLALSASHPLALSPSHPLTLSRVQLLLHAPSHPN